MSSSNIHLTTVNANLTDYHVEVQSKYLPLRVARINGCFGHELVWYICWVATLVLDDKGRMDTCQYTAADSHMMKYGSLLRMSLYHLTKLVR